MRFLLLVLIATQADEDELNRCVRLFLACQATCSTELAFTLMNSRLTLQHQLIGYRNSAHFVGPVDQVLAEAKAMGSHYPSILDVGCGPG